MQSQFFVVGVIHRKLDDSSGRNALAKMVKKLVCQHREHGALVVSKALLRNEQHQSGGMRSEFSSTLFRCLESSFVDPQLARKDGSRVAQSLTRVPDQLRINARERRWIHLVVAQSELTFAMDLHRGYAFHQC